jgi:sugar phosphate isomerase/epimerase
MKLVNHPAIAVNWDIMHPINRGSATMESAYQTLKPWIRHVHFHDGALREGKFVLVPIGEGKIDHRTAVKLLRDAGWTDYMSGEWISWEPYETHLPRELATMKRYEREA